jgi:glucose-6-phosphate 1-epimerase
MLTTLPHHLLSYSNSQALFHSKAKLPLICVNTPLCNAIISPQGAQLLQYANQTKQPWLFLNKQQSFQQGQAIIGGIPLCLPWFGRHANRDYPIHGYLQNQPWQLQQAYQQQQTVVLHFHYQHTPTTYFPFHFSAEHIIKLSDEIELTLVLHNQEQQNLPISFAWHSYFATANPAQIHGLEQYDFLDNLDGLSQKPQNGAIVLPKAIDAVFQQASSQQILQQPQQRLQISGEHCPTCIIWQPEQHKDFVCLERGAAFADTITLRAQQTFTSSMTIRETTWR